MNSLLVLFDSLSAPSLGCYGSHLNTPAIDRVGAKGDIFTNCYADAHGEALLKFIENLPTRRISDGKQEIDLSDLVLYESKSASALLVVRVAAELDVSACDQILERLFDQAGAKLLSKLNLIVTALKGGTVEKNDLIGSSDRPGEANAHVPLIISIAAQDVCRRRSALITTDDAVELTERLIDSAYAYAEHRDSLTNTQITYRGTVCTATRTKHWLHLLGHDDEEHEEASQQLYRKPEDVWEILDVADQYPQVIEHFAATGELTFPESV